MSDEAELNMLMYKDLKPDEESKLKSLDGDVSTTLVVNGIKNRAMWTSQSETEGRSIRLCIVGKSQIEILFEVTEEELASLSAVDILSHLRDSFA